MKQEASIKTFPKTLYIVPTPIGNLGDITQRALAVLANVNIIAAEDTRRTKVLLQHFNIYAHLFALHDYNEQEKTKILIEKLNQGQSIALVSDAGTPLINDPGYQLVKLCRETGIRVIPLPGACAAIVALSASGLPSDRFYYEGFLPKKTIGRCNVLKKLAKESKTMIFYESTHRLLDCLKDMHNILGSERYVVIAREITKIWESIYGAPISQLLTWVQEKPHRHKGEIVLVVEGYHSTEEILIPEALSTLNLLKLELPFKKAVILAAKIHAVRKNTLYKKYILLQQKVSDK